MGCGLTYLLCVLQFHLYCQPTFDLKIMKGQFFLGLLALFLVLNLASAEKKNEAENKEEKDRILKSLIDLVEEKIYESKPELGKEEELKESIGKSDISKNKATQEKLLNKLKEFEKKGRIYGWSQAQFSYHDSCPKVQTYDTSYSSGSYSSNVQSAPNCGTSKFMKKKHTDTLINRFLRDFEMESRIVGGEDAAEGQYPFMAAIGLKNSGQMCGASIINDRWILTAAHCFINLVPGTQHQYSCCEQGPCDWNIRLGETHLYIDDVPHVDLTPEKIIIHPQYDMDSFHNDIALMKVPRISFTENIQPICLPSPGYKPDESSECGAAGWGDPQENANTGVPHLQHLSMKILPDDECRHVYYSYANDLNICAGHLEGGKDTCQGDSGGPLVCKVNGKYTVAGVVSYGYGCARYYTPGVYVEVAHYLDWINSVMHQY